MTMPSTGTAATLPDFRGKPGPTDRHFFLPPPTDIGSVVAAESTLKTGRGPRPFPVRLLLILISVAVFGALGYWLLSLLNDDPAARSIVYAGTAILCLVVAIAAWMQTRFTASCAYIGEQGAVRYKVAGQLANPPKVQRIRFDQAAELRSGQTRQYVNGIYMGTQYDYRWTDPHGKLLLKLTGSYYNSKGNPKAGNPYYFAQAAEIAWTQYLLNRADQDLSAHGALRFNIDASRWVLVAPGSIEFHFGNRVDRCDAADIKSISLAGGTFTIHHKDAKWYSSKGKFSFAYARMANARLFAIVLDRFLPASLLGSPR